MQSARLQGKSSRVISGMARVVLQLYELIIDSPQLWARALGRHNACWGVGVVPGAERGCSEVHIGRPCCQRAVHHISGPAQSQLRLGHAVCRPGAAKSTSRRINIRSVTTTLQGRTWAGGRMWWGGRSWPPRAPLAARTACHPGANQPSIPGQR